MNGFWKRRLSALFLALIMTFSLIPMAMATGPDDPDEGENKEITDPTDPPKSDDHTHTYGKITDNTTEDTHTLQCTVEGCDQKETEAHSYIKAAVNATQHQEKCSVCEHIKANSTVNHNYGSWSPVDAKQHQQTCSDCSYTNKVNHTFTYAPLDGTQHSVSCSDCKETNFPAQDHTPDATGKCTLCSYAPDTCTVTFKVGTANHGSPVTVKKGAALPSNPTVPTKSGGYEFLGWTTTANTTAVYNGSGTYTKTPAGTAINADTTYYAVFQAKVTGKNVSVAAGTTNGKVVGTEIYTAINTAFKDATGRDLPTANASVTFSSATSTGVLYTNSTMGTLVSGTYTNSALSAMYFVPGNSTYTINYSVKDTLSIPNTVSGTLTITGTPNTKISYAAAPGKSVSFKDSEFFAIFKARTGSSDLRYVSFSCNDIDYDNFDGSIYAGSNLLNKDNLKNGRYYYTDGKEGDYSLSSLIFQADNGAKSGKLTLSFIAYGKSGNSDVSAIGTVELTINGTASGEVVYEVAPGGKVTLDPDDFNNVYRSLTGASRSIRYVAFSAPSNYASFNGRLVCGTEIFAQRDLAYDKLTFYYNSNSGNYDYDLGKVTFEAGTSLKDGDVLSIPFRAYYSESDWQAGTLKFTIKGDGGDISYGVLPGKTVTFKAEDFNRFFRKTYSGYTLSYVAFDMPSSAALSQGSIYYDYGKSTQTAFTRTSLDDERFYYSPGTRDYGLDGLTFVAGSGFKDNVELPFTAYGTASRSVRGTLVIKSSDTVTGGDVSYKVAPGQKVDMKRTDFNTFFRKNYDYTLNYIVFSRPDDKAFNNGSFYVNYGSNAQTSFTQSSFGGKRFYYNSANVSKGDYYLDDLSFVAGSGFQTAVSFSFTAYDSDSRYVDGTLTISPDGAAISLSNYTGSIRYSTTIGNNLQINANDLAQYYTKAAPGQTLQYVTLTGVPATGALYYNYYGASAYGTAARTQITSANFSAMALYHSPSGSGQYSLTELTYVPSGANYCATIPFIAYGTGAAVTGTILISVNSTAVPEVYGVVQRSGSIDLPASSIYNAILTATGSSLHGIQLLSLPAASVGTLYLGGGTSVPANTTTVYTYASGAQQMSSLRFVPAANYTGSVEIPYVALNSTGAAIACGTFSIGVVTSARSFSDMPNSTWCYKYVTELSDANVISGYNDGSFKPNSTVTYGAALKLIMLAAGYPEQAPTGSNVFSGYLDRARADGIITRSNVDLTAPITRLQVAQIAAGAMKLNTTNLSSVKPFTDTSDVYVQALNAAGIVEGYFANGTSTFKPSNTLTRGQISAIVWRMNRYNK